MKFTRPPRKVAKLYGHPIEDIDLFVVGHFVEPREFDVEYKFYPREGEPFVPRRASVRSFALVIEAKSHDATGVRFDAGFSDATLEF